MSPGRPARRCPTRPMPTPMSASLSAGASLPRHRSSRPRGRAACSASTIRSLCWGAARANTCHVGDQRVELRRRERVQPGSGDSGRRRARAGARSLAAVGGMVAGDHLDRMPAERHSRSRVAPGRGGSSIADQAEQRKRRRPAPQAPSRSEGRRAIVPGHAGPWLACSASGRALRGAHRLVQRNRAPGRAAVAQRSAPLRSASVCIDEWRRPRRPG